MNTATQLLKECLIATADYDKDLGLYDRIEAYLTKQQVDQEPVAWLVTTELQDGTRSTYPLTGRYKDVCDSCDFGNPIPLYTSRY